MLKQLYLILFISCCSSATWAQLPSNFPLYHEVVEHAINYTTCHVRINYPAQWKIIKNTEGFWITISYNMSDKTFKDGPKQLVWSPEKGFVGNIVLKGNGSGGRLDRDQLKRKPYPSKQSGIDEYNINRFFGMEDWMQKNIAYYQENPPKTYQEYYSLGRAHSYSITEYMLTYGTKHLIDTTPALLDSMSFHSDKAIACFKKTYELEPSFQTIVGSIYTKYCNEILFSSMQWAILGFKEKAIALVQKKELYTKNTLAFAKNSLLSCPPNAILFTYGDNDTYPLLYLQQAKNIRTDVLIINESLLTTDDYINHLRDANYYPKNHLQINLAASAYQHTNNQYIHLKENTKQAPWTVQQLIQLLESEKEEAKDIRMASTNRFVLGNDKNNAIQLECSKQYLVRNALLLLVILEQNHQTRPIMFAFSCNYQKAPKAIGLNKYLPIYGMNHQFKYQEIEPTSLTKKEALENYTLFNKQLKWPVFKEIDEGGYPAFYATVLNVNIVLEALIQHQQLKQAKKVQNKWYNSIKNVFTELDASSQILFIEQFYQLQPLEKANTLLRQYFTYLIEEELNSYETAEIINTIIPRIEQLMTTYETSDLSQQWEQVKAHYNKYR
ncbi:MAG: hypothetical protein ACRBFS_26305 [Aureispira sp.]